MATSGDLSWPPVDTFSWPRTNYVFFGEALRSTAIHVVPAALVVAESTDHDEVQCSVGLMVTPTVQAEICGKDVWLLN